ncbi:MAG: xanthine dehydrogenase family protein subunit M [Sphingobium sp.]
MQTFYHIRAASLDEARKAMDGDARTQLLCGGTTQVDLMKLGVFAPARIVDIAGLRRSAPAIEDHDDWLRLSAFMTMHDAIGSDVLKAKAPVVIDSLALAASTQIRNMASLGGNLMQRTRCPYYRDTSWTKCNRRSPGTGCQAIAGSAPAHAALGTSKACIATYPGDLAQALVALEASLEITGPGGQRLMPLSDLHRLPGTTPEKEHGLQPGEIIAAIRLPIRPWYARSRYTKVRDRASYEFAIASAAVALDLDGQRIRDIRVGLGGVATVPWRSVAAEKALRGKIVSEDTAWAAAEKAFADARPHPDSAGRVAVGKATLVRAILETATMETAHG